ncbi:GNAT family N-acetyltransferase [Methylophilus aquaticus]|uniref:GNAT family N-acetyltransferase n=1 Tax=Methylophilus aquaticus TaxID=1971610 RepID=A0ABT9JUD1_9PROT|nr:GNAT family N-acetyltransferase [Methylophilus aquaticus]MDP8567746.1 GNAT family N-acetyltransferase [Methylophilus aquaticus]
MTQQVEYSVRPAAPHEWRHCLSFIPEVLTSSNLPEVFFIAEKSSTNNIIGVACIVPHLRDVEFPGFPCFIRVLNEYCRLGIGRALVKEIAKHVSEWDVPYVLSWQSYPILSQQHYFLSKAGFEPYLSLYSFEVDRASAHILLRLLDKYLSRKNDNTQYTLVAVKPTAMSEEVKLYSQHFLVSYDESYRKLEAMLKAEKTSQLSASIYLADRCLGFIVGILDQDGIPKVDFWVTQKNIVHTPVALILLSYFVKNAYDMGYLHARFECNDKARSTLNVAKRLNARTILHSQSFALPTL